MWFSLGRIHHYYLFGLVLSGWIGYNAFWAYYSGAEVSERLQHLCEWALSPKQVKTGETQLVMRSDVFKTRLARADAELSFFLHIDLWVQDRV